MNTPKWIKRWVKRVKTKFPDCAVTCEYSPDDLGYLLQVFYPKEKFSGHGITEEGNWHIWGVLLNPSPSPSVRQNRKAFREDFDYQLRKAIRRLNLEWI